MSDYFETRERLRRQYIAPPREVAKSAKGETLGDKGFLTEIAGRVILTAPATQITAADQLPKELAERWEKAASGNPFMTWVQGRYVEAEKANRNGAYWSTDDLQFGEMSVRHGPLNWLHDEKTVIGTIADNALVMPRVDAQRAMVDGAAEETLAREKATDLFSAPMPRPYMAAVSAMWNWVHPDKVDGVIKAADQGKLWYSMECVGREISCVTDETHDGCGKSFDYVKAMTNPASTCEHIQSRSSARRIVDPAFLGGAVIIPPTQPGWGSANAELLRASAALVEQTHQASANMSDAEWVALMDSVVAFATH